MGQSVCKQPRLAPFLAVGVAIAFATCGCGGGGNPSNLLTPGTSSGQIGISPAAASLRILQKIQFTASGAPSGGVTWSATGGTISSDGKFTAGTIPGAAGVTVTSSADPSVSGTLTFTISRMFTSDAASDPNFTTAHWMYSFPRGSAVPISNTTSSFSFQINTHDGCWDYPMQVGDGSNGYTTFTDGGRTFSVPNPPNGYWPSTCSDGHLLIVDYVHGNYYDFWQLYATNGVPNSTHVGMVASNSLGSNGTLGTTGCWITGLAGDILPGELACEDCLNHTLAVVVTQAAVGPGVGKEAPAQRYDGTTAGALFHEGSKIVFDPSVDVDALQASTAVKAIMKALQKYGGTIVDIGGASNYMGFYSSLPTAPDETGLQLIGQHLLLYY